MSSQEKQTGIVTPRFLTEEIARTAVERLLPQIMSFPELGRVFCHIVILVPVMKKTGAEADWQNNRIEPHVLYEHSFGNKAEWPREFDLIARGKAQQLWYDRNDSRTDLSPHLLFPGDSPYWGGVKREGIVVTCSGVQQWFDRMIAGIISDSCIALAYNAWMISSDKEQNNAFLD